MYFQEYLSQNSKCNANANSVTTSSLSFNSDIVDENVKLATDKFHSHEKYRGKEPEYFCEFCLFETSYKYNLQKHLLKIHPGIEVKGTKMVDFNVVSLSALLFNNVFKIIIIFYILS